MGTGKSVVGRALAARLEWSFVETDEEIETREGRTIPEIFEQEGEPYFRRVEREVIESLQGSRKKVIATGGGAFVDPSNREKLRSLGKVVCLSASEEVLLERLGRSQHRPLMQVEPGERLGRLRGLLESRAHAYAQADWQVDTTAHTVDQVVDQILKQVRE